MKPAGRAPITPPIAHAMKPVVTSSGRTPKRSVPCSANHVVNVWNVSCSRSVATKMARMPGTAPRTADHAASTSDRKVTSAAADAGDARLAKPASEDDGDDENRAGRDQECRAHAERFAPA